MKPELVDIKQIILKVFRDVAITLLVDCKTIYTRII